MRFRFGSISRRFVGGLVLVWGVHAPSVASGQEDRGAPSENGVSEEDEAVRMAAGGRVYTLDQLLELAEANYPKVAEARARLRKKEGELWQARTAPFSSWQMTGGIGVAPSLRGTSVYSPSNDVALTRNLGLAWEIGLEGVLPLWTFGKITNLWDAAKANVELGRHEVNKEKNEIRMEIRRAYYGLLLARDSRDLLARAMRKIDAYIVELGAKVREGDADDVDLLKIQMERAEVVARGTEIAEGERKAIAGLRFYAGLPEYFRIPDVPLERISHPIGPVTRYLEAARLHRPELNMAKAGRAARTAQVALEKSKFYPDFGLGMTAKIQRAPEMTDQRNPFARDPSNRAWYGAGVVFRWNFDLLPQAARLAQAQAQLEEVRAIESYALGGIAAEVEVSHAQAIAAKERLEAWEAATNFAKRWMIKVQQGKDLGLFDDEDLVEPTKQYATKKAKEMEALYGYNLALARLSLTTGWESMLR